MNKKAILYKKVAGSINTEKRDRTTTVRALIPLEAPSYIHFAESLHQPSLHYPYAIMGYCIATM